MLESTSFTYNNIHSDDIGGVQCKVDSGLFEESFLPSRNILKESIRGRDKPYFMGFEMDPFEFTMNIYFEHLPIDERREVARMFMVDYYKPLIFDSNPDRIFYCMYSGDVDHLHNGVDEGYISLSMECNSPYSYSPVYTTRMYNLSSNSDEGALIEIENHGDGICMPMILLEIVRDGDISITNLSDGSMGVMELSDMLEGDVLEIDCENESIETGVAGVFRYDNHNDIYLRLVRGLNRIRVKGDCYIKFKYQFTLYQG